MQTMADRLHIEVRDWSCALPEEREYGADATTGRGMALVRSLALECGVRRLPDGKVIWFQIGDPPERPVDDRFLAMWDVDETNAAGTEPAGMRVGLINVPATLWLAARQHHDALLRAAAPVPRRAPDSAGRRCGGSGPPVHQRRGDRGHRHRAGVGSRSQPAPRGTSERAPWVPDRLDVSFDSSDDPAIFEALQDVLDEGERLAIDRQPPMRPGLPEIIAVRDWACEQAISQATGAPPVAWVGTGHEDFETAEVVLEAAHGWDTSHVIMSTRGVVAADDTNRIVAISRSLAQWVGWEPDELVGRRVVTLIPPGLREAHVAGFTRHLATGVAHAIGVPLTLPVLRKDGSEIECHFLIEQVAAPGGRTGYQAWISPVGWSEATARPSG